MPMNQFALQNRLMPLHTLRTSIAGSTSRISATTTKERKKKKKKEEKEEEEEEEEREGRKALMDVQAKQKNSTPGEEEKNSWGGRRLLHLGFFLLSLAASGRLPCGNSMENVT